MSKSEGHQSLFSLKSEMSGNSSLKMGVEFAASKNFTQYVSEFMLSIVYIIYENGLQLM